MGLFGKKKQSAEAADDDVAVYYSTPFGDTKDGKQKLFVLARDGVPFFPVFYTKESLTDSFERMNRAAYLIIEGNLKAVAESLRSIELMKNTGIVIEPFSEHPVEIMPGA
jgi:aspartyl/asparaginyl-tRNA synthetase